MVAFPRKSKISRETFSSLDEDSAHGSTVSTRHQSPKQPLQLSSVMRAASKREGRSRKSVSFATVEHVILPKGAANSKYSNRCWYTQDELKAFKLEVVKITKRLSENNAEANLSYLRVMTKVYQSCCDANGDQDNFFLSKKDRKDFQKCVANSNSRAGLECLIVPSMKQDLKQRRQVILKEISTMQDGTCNMPASLRNDMIRRCVEPLSLPSKLFALEKARAIQQQQ